MDDPHLLSVSSVLAIPVYTRLTRLQRSEYVSPGTWRLGVRWPGWASTRLRRNSDWRHTIDLE